MSARPKEKKGKGRLVQGPKVAVGSARPTLALGLARAKIGKRLARLGLKE